MKRTLRQLVRYGIVGLASNAVGFALYLVLTHFGLGPKTAMSLLYGVGVLQTFLFNRRWTFEHRGAASPAFLRYSMSYGLGYAANLTLLFILVDHCGYSHELVQGAAILSVAIMIFSLQKFWVFRAKDPESCRHESAALHYRRPL